jgi:cephalosporin hydroxylase
MKEWQISNPIFDADELNKSLAVSPWSGHRSFAYDLIRFLEPEFVLELGTHYGCSLFSFTQAVKDSGLETIIMSVDTWKGDEQAGFYGEEVFELVRKTIEQFFNQQKVVLNRKLFADALGDVKDSSVDILHIDGLHSYESVSTDFYTWLPKLKEDGIVLLHDVGKYNASGELNNYGSVKFWNEIKIKYNYFWEFPHSWGLGILFPKGKKCFEIMNHNNFKDKLKIYQYKAENERGQMNLDYVSNMAIERLEVMDSQTKIINELKSQLSQERRYEKLSLFRESQDNRYWWHKTSDYNYVPPIYSFLTEEEWIVVENWYEETSKTGITGEAAPPLMSVLQALIMGNSASNILQLGHYAGYSTLLLGFMSRRMGIKNAVFTIDIDPWCCEYTQDWINKAGLEEYVKVELNDSAAQNNVEKVRAYFGGNPKVVIIDSSHQYEHTCKELDLWYKVLQPGGFILMHDSSSFAVQFDVGQHLGVKKAIEDWLLKNPSVQMININSSNLNTDSRDLIYRDGCGLCIIHKDEVGNPNNRLQEQTFATIKEMENTITDLQDTIKKMQPNNKSWRLKNFWFNPK